MIQLEAISRSEFIETFGSIYESSPWVAEAIWSEIHTRNIKTVTTLTFEMRQIVDRASQARKLALINAHPELACAPERLETLTNESKREQTGVGLDTLPMATFMQFKTYNQAYRELFGHPFIICVKGHTPDSILKALRSRLKHDPDTELRSALNEIHKIAQNRLQILFT